jgi:hypothetical protein
MLFPVAVLIAAGAPEGAYNKHLRKCGAQTGTIYNDQQ